LDLISKPELATDRKIAAEIALLYFKTRGMIRLAEQNNFKEITRRINNGFNGYADRIKHYKASLKQFGVDVQV
jgi:putative chitinase